MNTGMAKDRAAASTMVVPNCAGKRKMFFTIPGIRRDFPGWSHKHHRQCLTGEVARCSLDIFGIHCLRNPGPVALPSSPTRPVASLTFEFGAFAAEKTRLPDVSPSLYVTITRQ